MYKTGGLALLFATAPPIRDKSNQILHDVQTNRINNTYLIAVMNN